MKNLPIIRDLSPEKLALLGQIARYAIVGFGVTCAQAAVYWTLATLIKLHAQIANFTGYLVAVVLGYVLHGAYSFRDQKTSHGHSRHAGRSFRFILVSLISLGINALWVWLTVTWAHGPTWAPIPLMLFVTPAIVFILNRRWVFR
jgi:putative flippase GtrA